MPIGVIVNALSVAAGGVLGSLLKGRLTESFQQNLNLIFGLCSIGIGVSAATQMENMPAG